MLSSYLLRIKCLLNFIINPFNPNFSVVSITKKLKEICLYLVLIQFFICAILLCYVAEIAEKFELFDQLEEVNYNSKLIVILLTGLIIAPLFEELIYRFPLKFVKNEFYFKWIYYLSAFIFGVLHIYNYEFDSSHYVFIPFITLNQIVSGLFLGYTRIIYGFWYGVLQHGLFNGLTLIWFYIIGFDL